MNNQHPHSADATALGFLYQGLFALLSLWRETDDDAVVLVETLDDVVLVANGETFLEQLKHSLSPTPVPLTISSVSLWKTMKAWIDVLPDLNLSQTRFNLVSVASIPSGSVLEGLLSDGNDRETLLAALIDEARRVQSERAAAKEAGESRLPHATKGLGCEAFLELSDDVKAKFIDRIGLKPGQNNIAEIEPELARSLTTILPEKRAEVARRLVEWWDRQILYSLCGRRERALTRFELVERYMEIVSDIELDRLTNPFETTKPPASYQPNSMIKLQINLVRGTQSELNRAIREEWRARETRSRWSTENPARHELITKYDDRMIEEWSDRHTEMCESCEGGDEEKLSCKGHSLLKWSHIDAPKDLEAIAPTVTAPYYIRGSYQVLSIVGHVGWHPDYRMLLGFTE